MSRLDLSLAAILLAAVPSVSAAPHQCPVDQPQPTSEDRPALTQSSTSARGHVPCVAGDANGFPCNQIDLMAHLTLPTIGGGNGSDLWGWTDSVTGREYALMCRSNGTAFIDVTDPEAPVYLGNLPQHAGIPTTAWHDVKVYADHAFIVADNAGPHGLQVFDLTQLRSVVSPPVTFVETEHFSGFGSAHNIVINEDTGFAYAVGGDQCAGGLYMIDISNPTSPAFAGCFSADGYTHDAQCVTYVGPDADHLGREVCFASNEDTLTIVDVTNKANPVQLSRTGYAGTGYAHQGWITDDHAFFLLDDELDENTFGHNTKTYVWDITDLDSPSVAGTYEAPTADTDHNQYIHNGYSYQANYRAGLRILRLGDLSNAELTEVAYFDTVPPGVSSTGAWSVYPYFDSGNVIVSDISGGLFVLEPHLCTAPSVPTGLSASPAGDNVVSLQWGAVPLSTTTEIYRAFGPCSALHEPVLVAQGVSGSDYVDSPVSGQVGYAYSIRRVDETGQCISLAGACVDVSTTGPCTAAPAFSGLGTVTSAAVATCGLDLSWQVAAANCGTVVTYSVYRSTSPSFIPAPGNRIVDGLNGAGWTDGEVSPGVQYFYIVRATDTGNGAEDSNLVEISAIATGPAADGAWATGAEIGDSGMIVSTAGLKVDSATKGSRKNNFPFSHPSCTASSTRPQSRNPQCRPSYNSGFAQSGKPNLRHIWARKSGSYSSANPKHIGWELSSVRAHQGSRSFFSGYANNLCITLMTPSLELTAGQLPRLTFWTAYEIESSYDGGVVEISSDGGTIWSRLELEGGYPGAFNATGDACGYQSGDPSLTGTALTWTEHSVDLAAFAGSEIQIRWIFSTDGGLTLEGWYLDNISVTHTQVPGPCAENSLFSDGFESADPSFWSSAVGG